MVNMKVNMKIANVAKETGALLTEYLQDRGLVISTDYNLPVICYGVPSSAKKALNGECGGGDKIRRLVQMEKGGVRTVPWFNGTKTPEGFQFPALARRMSGHGGEDIVPVFQKEEIPWRIKAGWDWFSSYIPIESEYRVWVFRKECLGIYRKVMARPRDYKRIGRNWGNGFDFAPCDNVENEVITEAIKAVRSVSFDFGAVDLLLGTDNLVYILEINSAPGCIKSGAQVTLANLADRMVNWVIGGYPTR